MSNFNKVLLMGNLTRDPEMRYTQGGTALCKFGMAVNRKYGEKETTLYIDLTAWAQQGENINKYCHKGDPLFVEGRLEYETWENKDGDKRSKISVTVENFQLMHGRDRKRQPDSAPPRRQPPPEQRELTDEDYDKIPF